MSNQLSANVDLRKKLELNSNLQVINGEKKDEIVLSKHSIPLDD